MPLLPPNSFIFHPVGWAGGEILTENYLKKKKKDLKVLDLQFPHNKTTLIMNHAGALELTISSLSALSPSTYISPRHQAPPTARPPEGAGSRNTSWATEFIPHTPHPQPETHQALIPVL